MKPTTLPSLRVWGGTRTWGGARTWGSVGTWVVLGMLGAVGLLGGTGCTPREGRSAFGSDVVATAYEARLTWDSLASKVPDDLNLEDSAAFAERVIDRWMREQVMLHNAEQHLQAERAQIQRALDAYRKSLTINTYETRYVESRLNTVVGEADVLSYYDGHQELFTLHDHTVRVLYAHLPDRAWVAAQRGRPLSPAQVKRWNRDQDSVRTWLARADSVTVPALERWCIEQGAMHHVDHEAWWNLSDLLQEIPLSLYRVEDQIQSTSPLSFELEGRRYFVRFLEAGLKGRTAPLEVARVQIEELILQARRQAMLEALRDTLYQRAWAEGALQRERLAGTSDLQAFQ